jgi:hypothetical protein
MDCTVRRVGVVGMVRIVGKVRIFRNRNKLVALAAVIREGRNYTYCLILRNYRRRMLGRESAQLAALARLGMAVAFHIRNHKILLHHMVRVRLEGAGMLDM